MEALFKNPMGVNRALTCVFYAINGTGLGHITRQRNIARDMLWLLSRMGIPAHFEFLTTSDAPQVAKEFLVTKLPSKTTVQAGGFNTRRFAAQARNMIGNYLSATQPDLLVVDTDPRGSFGEIPFVRGFAKRTVFVDRHKDPSVTRTASYQDTARLYDLVLVPEDEWPENACAAKNVLVGKIHGFRPENAMGRNAVRAHYGVNPDERLLYVSAGGGGDPAAAERLGLLLQALGGLENTVVVVGYGPLYEGPMCFSRRNVIPVQSLEMSQQFPGFDMAVSAGGYNTHEELLAACVPTLFYPQTKGLDRQDVRIHSSLERGWCGQIECSESEPDHVRLQVQTFLQVEAAGIRRNLLRREFPLGSLTAARHILGTALAAGPYRLPDAFLDEVVDRAACERRAAHKALFHEIQIAAS